MRSYISSGDSMQLTAPAGGVVSGQPYVHNSLIGVVMSGAPVGEKFLLKMKGAFAGIPKVAGEEWDIGDALYLTMDAELTTVAANGLFFGNAYYEATADETTGSVILVQTAPASGGGGDLSNYYTKTQVNTALSAKANSLHSHELAEINGLTAAINAKADLSALANKEGLITAGTSTQYYRGDKTMQVLNKGAVGLSAVDNTADTAKPLSSAMTTALAAKATTASLSPVAISGSYIDLTNKPVPFEGISLPADISAYPVGQLFLID